MSQRVFEWRVGSSLVAGLGLLIALAWPGLVLMVAAWDSREEYGYGYLVPLISAYLVWQRRDHVLTAPWRPSWVGVSVVVLGVLLILAGRMGSVRTVIQYGFVLGVLGMVWSLIGWRAFRVVAMPLAILFLMVPLPPFLYNTLSGKLQLISSELGVAFIRLFGVGVYLEGNVIDLGEMKLQVVDACSGLRYLFPLFVVSFVVAYIFRGALWKRLVVFLSAAPITVFMNSFRIGVIGLLVAHFGQDQAEGFLHYFEGWVIFMVAVGILIAEIALLSHIGRDRHPFSDAFVLDWPVERVDGAAAPARRGGVASWAAMIVVAVGWGLGVAEDARSTVPLERDVFAHFPKSLGTWQGRTQPLERSILEQLDLDDYIQSFWVDATGKRALSLYSAWYAVQEAGEASHSPRACIPGGGWQIESHEVRVLDAGGGLPVNRLLIRQGDQAQVVYYWFQGRGRVITSDYGMKLWLLWDAIARNRTDSALVRVTATLRPGQDPAEADATLTDFVREVAPLLPRYVP